MSVYKDPRSDNYTIEFQIGGERYKKTHDGVTSQRDAENLERRLKDEMKDRQRSQKDQRGKPMALVECVEHYVAALEGTSSFSGAQSSAKQVLDFFSSYKRQDGSLLTLLHEIKGADIFAFVQWKSAPENGAGRQVGGKVSNSTINQLCINFMRRICRHAESACGVELGAEPNWKEYRLKEQKKRTRRISDAEHRQFLDNIDPDIAYLLQFALVTGVRKTGSLLLWKNVDFKNKKFYFINKGNNPEDGFSLKEKTMTAAAEAILRSRVGHHPGYVFTRIGKKAPFRGVRIPIKSKTLDEHWRKIRDLVGAKTLCWHDLRRSFASHLYKITKDLALVQDALNHASIETTRGYVVVDNVDLVAGMSEAEKHFMEGFSPVQAIAHRPRLIEDKREAG